MLPLHAAIIENFRAIRQARIELDPRVTVFFGGNAAGKTSVLDAVAIALGAIPARIPRAVGRQFAKTGDIRIPWRDLPERFGPWTTVFTRFSWWSRRGFFEDIALALREEIGVDLSEASIDSTTVKLHASAHGEKKVQPKVGRAVAGRRKSTSSPMRKAAA